MFNILITGGAGFIGSHFTRYCVHKNKYNKIVVLDALTYAGDLKRLNDVIDDVIFIEGDINDHSLLKDLFNQYDFNHVVNFAAESHVDRSLKCSDAFVRTNINGVKSIMDVMRSYIKSSSRFVQISTDEVYGGVDIEADYKTEDAVLNPKNPYAASKASAELMVKAYEHTFNFPSIITRSSNNYGLYQNEEKLIPKVIQSLKLNKEIELYGQGDQYRNWLDVVENVTIIYEVLWQSDIHEVYNISGSHFVSNKELVESLIDVYEKDHYYSGKIVFIDDRPGHDFCYKINDEKVRKLTKIAREDFHHKIHFLIESSID